MLNFGGCRFISCDIQQRAKHVARVGYLRNAHKILTPKTELKILVVFSTILRWISNDVYWCQLAKVIANEGILLSAEVGYVIMLHC